MTKFVSALFLSLLFLVPAFAETNEASSFDNKVIGKISAIPGQDTVTIVIFEKIPDTVKLFHVYDQGKERIVGTLMVRDKIDAQLANCTLVDGEWGDIRRGQELFLNYNVNIYRKPMKFIDIGASARVSFFEPNANFWNGTGNYLKFRGGISAQLFETIGIGGYISGSTGVINFGVTGQYLFGKTDDIISPYALLDVGVGLYNGGSGSFASSAYFSLEPCVGLLMFRKYSVQVFVEAGYHLPSVFNGYFNTVAGIDAAVGVTLYFTKLQL